MQQAVKPQRSRSYVLGFKPGANFGVGPLVHRRINLPPPVDIEKLKREAWAGRELMKEMPCSN